MSNKLNYSILLTVSVIILDKSAFAQCHPFQISKLTASDNMPGDEFGQSLAVDNDTAIVGAQWDDDRGANSGSAYVFRKISGNWQQIAELHAEDGAPFDQFGSSVSISGNVAVIGAIGDDDEGISSGATYVFEETDGEWQQLVKLTPSDPRDFHWFGWSVAISGSSIAIGTYRDSDLGSDSGAAYVFERNEGLWQQVIKLNANDAAIGDRFGDHVAISGDTLFVGAPFDDDGELGSGSTYVFAKSQGTWHQTQKLNASIPVHLGAFGHAIAIDADVAVIGASGSVNIFQKTSGQWVETAQFLNNNVASAVAIQGDSVVVGAHLDDGAGLDAGAAYVFRRWDGSWFQTLKLFASDAAVNDNLGHAVAIINGNALVAAPLDDDACGVDVPDCRSGGVYEFQAEAIPTDCNNNTIPDECELADNDCNQDGIPDECQLNENDCNRNGIFDVCELLVMDCNFNGIVDDCDIFSYREITKVSGQNSTEYDFFGRCVSVSGGLSAVGAELKDNGVLDGGSAFVFRKDDDSWVEAAELTAEDSMLLDHFGSSICVNNDVVIVGATLADSGNVSDCGAIYVFNEVDGNWGESAKLVANDPEPNGQLGGSVSVHNGIVVAGASGNMDHESVYVFRDVGDGWEQVAKLTPSGETESIGFGSAVSIGNGTLVVGAPFADSTFSPNTGAVFIYREVAGVWQELARLVPSDSSEGDRFGASVSLSGDTVAIGATGDDDRGISSGSCYVFREIDEIWHQVAKLTAMSSEPNDAFGCSISLSQDTIVVGSNGVDGILGSDVGAAFVFRRILGSWQEMVRLEASDPMADDRFGTSVALDGKVVLIGSFLDDDYGTDSGSAYVFGLLGDSHDCNLDGIPDECDPTIGTLAQFVASLLNGSSDPISLCFFDRDLSGVIDGHDIAPMIMRLLAP